MKDFYEEDEVPFEPELEQTHNDNDTISGRSAENPTEELPLVDRQAVLDFGVDQSAQPEAELLDAPMLIEETMSEALPLEGTTESPKPVGTLNPAEFTSAGNRYGRSSH